MLNVFKTIDHVLQPVPGNEIVKDGWIPHSCGEPGKLSKFEMSFCRREWKRL